jgi:hypothetical protein
MKIYKKLSIIFSAFIVAFFGEIAINIACGGEADPYDYYINYFHNNVQGDSYTPFAYNSMIYLNSENDVVSEADINSNEWADFLKVKPNDVLKAMYQVDSATSVKLANFDGNSSNLPDSLSNNSFLLALSKNKSALKYFSFAKSCEPLANVTFNLWDPLPRDTSLMEQKGIEAEKLTNDEKNSFLKLRYAYQAQRMYQYGNFHNQSKQVYEKYIKGNKSNSAVNGWSLALYAGSIRKLGNPDESAYLFSKVFASNPERRVQAYKNYYYINAPVKNVLKFAINNDEKANIWAINGFGNPSPDLQSLRQVYQLSPKSLLTSDLLVREVNKLENALIDADDIAKVSYDYYFSYNDNKNYTDSIKNANLNHLKDIIAFSVNLSADKKYPQAELGTLTAAYLSWIENKDEQASDYLTKLNPQKLNSKFKDQYRIIDLLLQSKKIKKGSTFNENDLLPTLNWLDEKRFAENKAQNSTDRYIDWRNDNLKFTHTTRDFYQQILAPAYIKMGDTAKAALAMVKGDLKYKTLKETSLFKNIGENSLSFWQLYLSPKSMASLANYKTKANGNDVTALLAKALNQLSNDDFYELYGTSYLRTHQYAKALQMFNKISASYKYFSPEDWYSENEETKLYANPFVETINDYPKKRATLKTAYNKKTFAAEMLRVENITKTSSDKNIIAQNLYKMANATYQTGYFGNSWFFINYNWSSYDNRMKAKFAHDDDYKKALTAKKLYLKARELSTDPNFKAKCTFMLAKCTQKQIIMNSPLESFSYYDTADIKWKSFIKANYNNPYFKEMNMKYKSTPFFKTAANTCSYMADFIR